MYSKALRLLVGTMPVLLAISCTAETEDKLFTVFFGVTVLILAATLCFAICISTVVFLRRLSRTPSAGPDAGGTTWHTGLVAASIALFGVLITGVFVFMSLQIETSAERAARDAATDAARDLAKQAAIQRVDEITLDLIDGAVKSAIGFSGQVVSDFRATSAPETSELECVRTAERSETSGQTSDLGPTCGGFADSYATISNPDNYEESIDLEGHTVEQFCFSAAEGLYRISATAAAPLDPIVSLYNASGHLLYLDDDGGDDLASCFEIVLEARPYLRHLADVKDQAGSHTLSIEKLP